MSEQERLDYLTARFLRLNEEGKVYMNTVTRQLVRICGPPEKTGCGTSAAREEPYWENGASSGFDGIDRRA
ncbi:MAG: hypothetical protein LBP81_09015 [Treponema sp.]|nr:hypothetical protein [Treponema sp.]